jgi:2-oxopent-4-enoate/cis-2-oxohex-4-enoate hydratase
MDKPTIFVNPKSGSIKINGEVDVVDVDGKVVQSLTNPKLCGCGLSKDKPWCDSSHGEYVKIVAQQLRNARELVKPCNLFGTTTLRAQEIRENELKFRQEAGEELVGVKYGGTFGYLTNAMDCKGSLPVADYMFPFAEAEVVFKLKKEINSPIELHEVLDYVSHVSAGMEIYDSRFGDAEASFNDSVADNASAAAFSYSEWIPASADILDGLEAKVFVNDDLVEETLLTSIRGNPWMAVVALSTELAAMGIRLPAGSIVFSGSATQEILMRAGSTYKVEIKGLGTVVVTAS